MTLPAEIARLIETFERNKEAYRQSPYNETQLHRELIDPFFKALGWDMDNIQSYAEAHKREEAASIGPVRRKLPIAARQI